MVGRRVRFGWFFWEECGRAYVARFGALSASVRCRGNAKKGTLLWRVGDVFGNGHLGKGDWEELRSAILEAESILIREAKKLSRKFERFSS